MIQPKEVQNPDDYTEEDYQTFETKLFSPDTEVSELGYVCMTLAYLPTKQAQDLLGKFRETDRAGVLVWLDKAVEEGQLHYISPQNKQEDKDYLALKVMQEIEDEIAERRLEYEELQLRMEKMEIEHEAVRELVEKGELEADAEQDINNEKIATKSRVEKLSQHISIKEKTVAQIKKSIQTERYKTVSPVIMRHVHFC